MVIYRIINALNSLKTENLGRAISLELGGGGTICLRGAKSLGISPLEGKIPSELAPGGARSLRGGGETPVTPVFCGLMDGFPY